MTDSGLFTACRYAYPPNSLSLCGPNKQLDLQWYSSSNQLDAGTTEVIQQFSTLYPYLQYISAENNIFDPFDTRVVEAYWIGNSLLHKIKVSSFIHFIDEHLLLSKKNTRRNANNTKSKIGHGGLPNHAFHVLNVYVRTGMFDSTHTISTADACIVNWGEVCKIEDTTVYVKTKKLIQTDNGIQFSTIFTRKIVFQGENDYLFRTIKKDDIVSYHWGYICEKLSKRQVTNLQRYNELAIRYANLHYAERTYHYRG